jgi:SAM-dependent methyltransferase
MDIAGYIVGGLIALTVLVGLIWRLFLPGRPCQVWLARLIERDNPLAKANRAAVIIDRLDVRPGMAVLDVGCGPARLTIPLAERVGEHGAVVAVDMQDGMLARAADKAQAAKLANIQFVLARAGEGRLERNRFDRAVLITVLGEIIDRDAALMEIFESLKPGGILSVIETIFDPHFQTYRSVRQRTEAAGFREVTRYGNWLGFTLNLQRPATAQASLPQTASVPK